MANELLTPDAIAAETLVRLDDNLAATQLFHRDFEPEFNGGVKVGDTIKIRKPVVVEAKEFDRNVGIEIQDVKVSTVDLTIDKHFDVSYSITTKELTMDLNDFANEFVIPAVVAISEKVEAYVQSKYVEVPNAVGTPGSPPDSLADLMQIGAYLTHWKVPLSNRIGLVDPFTAAALGSSGDLMRADAIADAGRALREAEIGRKGGINWYTSRLVNQHTAGTLSNGTIHGGKLKANALKGAEAFTITDTTLTGTVVKGDVFTIAGVNDFKNKPIWFTATATATAGTNEVAVQFYPPLPKAVSANAIVTIAGDHTANLVGHPFGLTYAMVTPELPMNTGQRAASLNYRGLGIRVVYGYDMNKKDNIISFDTMCGAKVIQPELLARLFG